MKIESLKHIFITSALRPLVISILILIGLQSIIIYDFNQQKSELSQKELSATINKLQNQQSEKIALIANSPEFIDYLRSGEQTRKTLDLDIEILLSSLNDPSITGYQLDDLESDEVLFNRGENTQNVVPLKLCYLDSYLDNEFGRCVARLSLFLNTVEIAKQLKEINPRLDLCTDCKVSYLQDPNSFGSFTLTKSSPLFLNIKHSQASYSDFYLVEIVFVLVLIGTSIWLYRAFNTIADKYVYTPVKDMVNSLNSSEMLDEKNINVSELNHLAKGVNSYLLKLKQEEELLMQASLLKLAKQVAHDIRSPLTALKTIELYGDDLPPDVKGLMESSINRITEIANDLLQQGKQCQIRTTSIVEMVKPILAEKKAKYSGRSLDLHFYYSLPSRLFINVNPCEFKRMLSNLLDNAIEADLSGNIQITAKYEDDQCFIVLKDHGKGIPEEHLKVLGKETFTAGKKDGNGLGLIHAFQFVESVNGSITITSQPTLGTEFNLSFPAAPSPRWILNHLDLAQIKTIVVVDDDLSIHKVWQSRLKHLDVKLVFFNNPEDFLEWFPRSSKSAVKYFIDYDFRISSLKGSHLIEKLNIALSSILFTSKASDFEVRKVCEDIGAHLYPKDNIADLDIMNTNTPQTYVLIDDEKLVHISWKLASEKLNIPLKTYYSVEEFLNDSREIPKSAKIFVDSNLGSNIKGETESERIFAAGFLNLFISTNYEKSSINRPAWIKEVLSKTPEICFNR